MHEALFSYIQNYIKSSLTKHEEELLRNSFTPKRIRKHQYFLQEGEVCKFFGFIIKGATKQYSIDEKGVEHIVSLCIENWWIGDRESYIMLTPSPYNIDAVEDTDVLMITRADQLTLWNSVPRLNELSLKLDEKHAFANQKRLTDLVSLPAETRYEHLVESYPEFLQRFPQHLIASYLGITKETLSRIRKKRAGK